MEDNMAVAEPLTHEDGSPVTVEDVEASQLRQEMLDFLNAMRGFRRFISQFENDAKLRLADNMARIMAHADPINYTWEEWVQNNLYPEG